MLASTLTAMTTEVPRWLEWDSLTVNGVQHAGEFHGHAFNLLGLDAEGKPPPMSMPLGSSFHQRDPASTWTSKVLEILAHIPFIDKGRHFGRFGSTGMAHCRRATGRRKEPPLTGCHVCFEVPPNTSLHEHPPFLMASGAPCKLLYFPLCQGRLKVLGLSKPGQWI